MNGPDSSEAGEWVRLAPADDLADGQMKHYHVSDVALVLCRIRGVVRAFGAFCPHRGALLCQGSLRDAIVTCPWHGWRFDVVSGQGITNQHAALTMYPVEEREDGVFVRI